VQNALDVELEVAVQEKSITQDDRTEKGLEIMNEFLRLILMRQRHKTVGRILIGIVAVALMATQIPPPVATSNSPTLSAA
jgi:hypothetical protein